MTLARALMAIKGQAAPEVVQAYSRARELCERLQTSTQLCLVLWGLAGCHMVRGELQTARDLGQQLLTLGEGKPDLNLRVGGHMSIGLPLFWQGKFEAAQEHLEDGIADWPSRQHPSTLREVENHCMMLSYSALALWLLGYPDQAKRRSDEAIGLARQLGRPANLAVILDFSAWFFLLRREWQQVQERSTEAITLATDQGLQELLAIATILAGRARAEHGYGEEGIARARRGLASYRATGAQLLLPLWLSLLTEMYTTSGKTGEALRMLNQAFGVINRTGERSHEAELYRLQGQLVLQKGDVGPELRCLTTEVASEAETYFLKAVTIARQQRAKSLELRATMRLSRLWQCEKKRRAHAMLSAIYCSFTEGFDTKDLREAEALLRELS
jgi:predicted ATPase